MVLTPPRQCEIPLPRQVDHVHLCSSALGQKYIVPTIVEHRLQGVRGDKGVKASLCYVNMVYQAPKAIYLHQRGISVQRSILCADY